MLAHLEAVSGVTFHHECDEIILTSSEVRKLLIKSLNYVTCYNEFYRIAKFFFGILEILSQSVLLVWLCCNDYIKCCRGGGGKCPLAQQFLGLARVLKSFLSFHHQTDIRPKNFVGCPGYIEFCFPLILLITYIPIFYKRVSQHICYCYIIFV